MSEFEKDLIESLGEAVAHAEGKATGVRVTNFLVPDVRAIRENLHLSQAEFADAHSKSRSPLYKAGNSTAAIRIKPQRPI